MFSQKAIISEEKRDQLPCWVGMLPGFQAREKRYHKSVASQKELMFSKTFLKK